MSALTYKVLQVFSMPTMGKVVALLITVVPVVIVGSWLYKSLTGISWREAAFKIYIVLSNSPGADVTQEERARAGVLVNFLYMIGLLSFAVLLGVITDDISSAVQHVRSGNYAIHERQHTLILGWNRQLTPVLRQIALAQQERGSGVFNEPIVVLAEQDKEYMDGFINEELESGGLNIITRTGSPAKLSDLEKVAAGEAHTVIVLHTEQENKAFAVAQKAACLVALKTAGGVAGQNLVVQAAGIADEEFTAAMDAFLDLQRTTNPDMVMINSLDRISQLTAQCALVPGLSAVFSDILQQSAESAEYYIMAMPEFEGVSFGTARRLLDSAVLVGVLPHGSARALLSPPDSTVINQQDKCIFVAHNAADITARDAPVEVYVNMNALHQARHTQEDFPNHVLVLCWGQTPQFIVNSLVEFAHPGSKITVIHDSMQSHKDFTAHGVSTHYISGNPSSSAVLTPQLLARADSVVLAGIASMPPDHADAHVVSSVITLQKRAAGMERQQPLRIIAPVHSPQTVHVLKQVHDMAEAQGTHVVVETIMPDDLMSGLVTQLAADPSLNVVLHELFGTAGGCEMYLKHPSYYALTPATAAQTKGGPAWVAGGAHVGHQAAATRNAWRWADVQEAVRDKKEVVIGVVFADGSVKQCLNVEEVVDFTPDDRLVVIAEDL